ncbi:hypothetical protein ACFLRN_04850 [Thermoproteota archaeon]
MKIIYSLTVGGPIVFFLYFYVSYCLGNFGFGGDIVSTLLYNLPVLFFVSALPLAIFTAMFLTKGGGLKHFRSLNSGKKVLVSGLAMFVGYFSVLLTPQPYYDTTWLNQWNYYYTYFGLILIALGFTSLVILSKRNSSSKEEKANQKPNKMRKKTLLIVTIVFLIFSILLVGFHLKIQRENDYLQQQYLELRESFPFLVNDEWTNMEGVDANYVNYKGSLFNSGRDKIYNATLLVRIEGVDGTTLERVEFFIGDINGWDYQVFDFNIEYSGEMTDLTSGYSWDNPNSIHG